MKHGQLTDISKQLTARRSVLRDSTYVEECCTARPCALPPTLLGRLNAPVRHSPGAMGDPERGRPVARCVPAVDRQRVCEKGGPRERCETVATACTKQGHCRLGGRDVGLCGLDCTGPVREREPVPSYCSCMHSPVYVFFCSGTYMLQAISGCRNYRVQRHDWYCVERVVSGGLTIPVRSNIPAVTSSVLGPLTSVLAVSYSVQSSAPIELQWAGVWGGLQGGRVSYIAPCIQSRA